MKSTFRGCLMFSLLALICTEIAHAQNPTPHRYADQTLTAGNSVYQQGFGKQIAVDGEWLAVTNRLDSTVAGSAGSIHIYRRGAGGYELFQVVYPDPVASQSLAIYELRIKDGVLAVPAVSYPYGGYYGTVYVFEFNGVEWVRKTKLFPLVPILPSGGLFGVSLAIADSGTILVGASLDPISPIDTTLGNLAYEQRGAVFVFSRIGGVWTQTQKLELTHPSVSAGSALGWMTLGASNLAVDGDTAIVGGGQGIIELHQVPMFHANVIERDANGFWSESPHIEHPGGHFMENYNSSVAIEGDLIAIGAPVDAGLSLYRPGYVYLYRNGATGWVQEAILEASDSTVTTTPGGMESDRFGHSVDIENGRVLVGARRAYPDRGQDDLGSGYLFEKHNGTWEEVTRFWTEENDPNPNRPQFMGQAVALIGDTAIVSDDLGTDGNTWGAGSVHVFFLPFGDSTCAGQANSTGEAAWIEAVGSQKVANEHLVLRSGSVPDGFAGYLLAGTQGAFLPGVGGSMGDLCLGGALARFKTQAQVSANGEFEVDVNVHQIPTVPTSSIMAGDTWHFQFWYRDYIAGPTSNLSEAVAVTFH